MEILEPYLIETIEVKKDMYTRRYPQYYYYIRDEEELNKVIECLKKKGIIGRLEALPKYVRILIIYYSHYYKEIRYSDNIIKREERLIKRYPNIKKLDINKEYKFIVI